MDPLLTPGYVLRADAGQVRDADDGAGGDRGGLRHGVRLLPARGRAGQVRQGGDPEHHPGRRGPDTSGRRALQNSSLEPVPVFILNRVENPFKKYFWALKVPFGIRYGIYWYIGRSDLLGLSNLEVPVQKMFFKTCEKY